MQKTADFTVAQKTIMDTIHKKGKQKKVSAKKPRCLQSDAFKCFSGLLTEGAVILATQNMNQTQARMPHTPLPASSWSVSTESDTMENTENMASTLVTFWLMLSLNGSLYGPTQPSNMLLFKMIVERSSRTDYTSCPGCISVLVLVHEVYRVPKPRSHLRSHWPNKLDFRVDVCLGSVWVDSVTVAWKRGHVWKRCTGNMDDFREV